ncbi:hypothetical protein GpartN1_g680.t1 [Galdieria partita]|uniref:Uncharacterized protein n=1 Tax=Galdieria partita TaxID=83374 RepID=A0A9C7UMQ6_9RHOD|nr:hypothetical protein GpartN1_g680.t1 [Galdieria partita]
MQTELKDNESITHVKTPETKPTNKRSKAKKVKVSNKGSLKSPNKRRKSTKGSITTPRRTTKRSSNEKSTRTTRRRVSKLTSGDAVKDSQSPKRVYRERSNKADKNTKDESSSMFSTWCVIA